MRGISKETLESKINELHECSDRGNNAINGLSAGANIAILKALLNECKELPDQQWQTIEEFKANPVDGYYFAMVIGINKPLMAYVKDSVFYVTGSFQDSNQITQVMPIKTPEAPK